MKLSKKEYRAVNKNFLRDKASQTNVHTLDKGVLYEVIEEGHGDKCPQLNDVVSVHYHGTLIDGTEFDSTLNTFQAAFRLREVIEGWQIALQKMKVGDKWRVFIPKDCGYGDKKTDTIPGWSTLIFEIELIAID